MKILLVTIIALAITSGCAPAAAPLKAGKTMQLEQLDKWRLKIVFTDNNNSFPQKGSFEFQSLKCGGDFNIKEVKPNSSPIILQQNMTFGSCVPNCEIIINRDMATYQESCKGKITGYGNFKTNDSTEELKLLANKQSDESNDVTKDSSRLSTECDKLAASKNDETRPEGIKGISLGAIDNSSAIPICQKASDGDPGNARLLFQLARSYHKAGRMDEAYAFYRKAAEMGHPHAQYNLGLMYEEGKFVGQDNTEAYKWFKKSAENGHEDGQSAIDTMLLDGSAPSHIKQIEKERDKKELAELQKMTREYRGGKSDIDTEPIVSTPTKMPEPPSNFEQVATMPLDTSKLILSRSINKSDTRKNPDNMKFYRTKYKVSVQDGKELTEKTIETELYTPEDMSSMQPSLMFDPVSKVITIFASGKGDSPNDYSMVGYAYRLDSSQKWNREIVFPNGNFGWFSYFGGSANGNPELWHFSFAGYRLVRSVRSASRDWQNSFMGGIAPEIAAKDAKNAKKILVGSTFGIQKPSVSVSDRPAGTDTLIAVASTALTIYVVAKTAKWLLSSVGSAMSAGAASSSSSSTFGTTDSVSTTSSTAKKNDGNYECSYMCWDQASPHVLDLSKKLSTEHKITVSGSDYSSAREKGLKIAKQACKDMGFYDTYSRWGKGIIDCKDKK